MTIEIQEPTKKDVTDFVEKQLYDIEAYGWAHKDTLIDGIMGLLKRQHDYSSAQSIQQERELGDEEET